MSRKNFLRVSTLFLAGLASAQVNAQLNCKLIVSGYQTSSGTSKNVLYRINENLSTTFIASRDIRAITGISSLGDQGEIRGVIPAVMPGTKNVSIQSGVFSYVPDYPDALQPKDGGDDSSGKYVAIRNKKLIAPDSSEVLGEAPVNLLDNAFHKGAHYAVGSDQKLYRLQEGSESSLVAVGSMGRLMVGLASDGNKLFALGSDKKLYELNDQSGAVLKSHSLSFNEQSGLSPQDLASACTKPVEIEVFSVFVAKIGTSFPAGISHLFIQPGSNNPYFMSPVPATPPSFLYTIPFIPSVSTGYVSPINVCGAADDLMSQYQQILSNANPAALNPQSQAGALVEKIGQRVCKKVLGPQAVFDLAAAQQQGKYPKVSQCQFVKRRQDLEIGDGLISQVLCRP